MRYQLIKPINPKYNVIEQILTNRGIKQEDVYHYLNTTDDDISDPKDLGEDLLKQAIQRIATCVANQEKMLIICDCDCDGFTSASLLINYLYDLFPSYVETKLKWYVHEDKQHGLSDCMEYINSHDFKLIIVPDAGSNDYEYHKELKDKEIDVIVLDHHLADEVSPYALVINNQLTDTYKNKELSGVGVVYQFCRYIDKKMNTNYVDNYLDLVALGLTGDMMSLTSMETKHLIHKGFEPQNIHNPYIYEMWQKNKFKLGEHITSIDAAFYIVPMINAVQRSGTIEEKEILFKSMLKYEAFNMIPSTKKGCKGQEERLVDQAVRMSTNVKNRQTRVQDASIEYLESLIEKHNLLDHKVLLFTLERGKVDKNVAGLIANKFAAKYQRPCCILTLSDLTEADMQFISEESKPLNAVLQGSARGYEASGITNFKDICDNTRLVNWTAGHQNAFGISINVENVNQFLAATDKALKDMSSEPVYYVDYIYNGADVNAEDILSISNLNNLWGKDMDEAFIAIKNLKVSKDLVTVYRKTSNTLKITLPNNVSLMKFNATDEECEALENHNEAYISIDAVGKCRTNEWMGNISAQLFIEDYEITGSGKYLF